MTTITSNGRRLRFRPDQADVPPADRAADLVHLAEFVASVTDPAQTIALEAEDRLLLDMVAELHTAEIHDRSGDHNQHDAQQAEVHRQSAAGPARDAVDADLKAGAR